MEIDARQYAKIDMGGLFVMFESAGGATFLLGPGLEPKKGSFWEGDDLPLNSGILMA